MLIRLVAKARKELEKLSLVIKEPQDGLQFIGPNLMARVIGMIGPLCPATDNTTEISEFYVGRHRHFVRLLCSLLDAIIAESMDRKGHRRDSESESQTVQDPSPSRSLENERFVTSARP